MKHRANSLTAHFGLLLLISCMAAAAVFCGLRFGGGLLLELYFERSDFQERYDDRRIQNFSDYVDRYGLSASDTEAITDWVKRHHLILLEIYRANILRYSSSAPEVLQNNEEVPYYAWVSYYEIPFADGTAEVVIYADDTYRFFTVLTVISLGLALVIMLFIILRSVRRLVRYICRLSEEIQAMEGGDLDVPITFMGDHELTRLAHSLDSMRRAFQTQKEAEADIFRANQEMITAMSHDLRTPLTTLQIYTDILRYKKYVPEQLDGYLEIIDSKAAQIKQLAENIFEYSLVSRHQSVALEPPRYIRDIFHDALSGMVADLGERGFAVELELDWPDIRIAVNSQYIKRLLDNITSNLEKYADDQQPIQITAGEKKGGAAMRFQNAVSEEPSRQESTQIGLVNMKAMMQKMGGTCEYDRSGPGFCLELWFPSAHTRSGQP